MTELIRSGGFQGGVSTGPRSQIIDDRKARLADALERLSGNMAQAGEQRIAIRTADLRRDAEEQANVLIADRLRGYNAEQLGEFLAGDETAREFADNPYILPAIRKHRGRTLATERFQRMTENGVDPSDRAAVQAWLQENPSDIEDPFEAAGYNEQTVRHDAQLSQMQFNRVLEEARQQTRDAFSSEIEIVLENPEREPGDVMANIWEAAQTLGIRGGEVSDILLNRLRRAAAEGDLETAKLLAETPRPDGVPSLLNDTRLSGSAGSYLSTAERAAEALLDDQRIEAMDGLLDRMVMGGATLASIERSDEWATLTERQRSQLRGEWRRETHRRTQEAQRTNAASWSTSVRNEALRQYVAAGLSGEPAVIDDIEVQNPYTGRTETIRANELRDGFRDVMRQQLFPGGVLSPEQAAPGAYRQYARALAVNGINPDPQLTFLFGSTASLMGAEGISDADAPRVMTAFRIYQQLPEHLRGEYVRDARMEATFSALRDELEAFPQADPAQALRTANAVATTPIPYENQEINQAISSLNLTVPDPDNPTGMLWFRAPGQVEASLQAEREASVEMRRALAQGLSMDRATERAQNHVARNWVTVNGAPVRLPPERTGDRNTNPESWRADVIEALNHIAREDGLEDASEYRIAHRVGQVYTLTRPAGVADREASEDIPASTIQLLAHSSRRAGEAAEAEERAADELARADRALAERERRRQSDRSTTRAGLSTLPLTRQEADDFSNQ